MDAKCKTESEMISQKPNLPIHYASSHITGALSSFFSMSARSRAAFKLLLFYSKRLVVKVLAVRRDAARRHDEDRQYVNWQALN